MNEDELKRYLVKVAKHGYADREKEREWTKLADHSTRISHVDDPWSMDDNFFGGEPYGGREVVFFEGRPVWMMVYYGTVSPTVSDVRAVYACLQDALAHPPDELPVRGPRTFGEGPRRYEAWWDGTIRGFHGSETIFDGTDEIYRASFAGGMVDARAESPA